MILKNILTNFIVSFLLITCCLFYSICTIANNGSASLIPETEISQLNIPARGGAYGRIANNVVINSRDELNNYIKLVEAKIGNGKWNNTSKFINILKSDDIDFNTMNVLIFFPGGYSSSVYVMPQEPVWEGKNALINIILKSPEIATTDVVDYAYAYKVNKSIPKVIFKLGNKRIEIINDDSTIADIWSPITHSRECTSNFAINKETHPICVEFIDHWTHGPIMMVIPSKSETKNVFAIGVYETSVTDYLKYCKISGRCEFKRNRKHFSEPLYGINIKVAQEYVTWLSERTGKTYRLPTRKEWTYAVTVTGNEPKSGVICEAPSPVDVKHGRARGWGLKNYVGNVQEWVIDDGEILAMGGSYSDSIDDCDISLAKKHSGEGDEFTGFRVLLELN